MRGPVKVSSSREAIRQSCCVLNSRVVTVADAALLVASVKITNAHMTCPFDVLPEPITLKPRLFLCTIERPNRVVVTIRPYAF